MAFVLEVIQRNRKWSKKAIGGVVDVRFKSQLFHLPV